MRHNERNESLLCELKDEAATLAEIADGSATFGTRLVARGNELEVALLASRGNRRRFQAHGNRSTMLQAFPRYAENLQPIVRCIGRI